MKAKIINDECYNCAFYSTFAKKCICKINGKCCYEVFPQWKKENFKKLENEKY